MITPPPPGSSTNCDIVVKEIGALEIKDDARKTRPPVDDDEIELDYGEDEFLEHQSEENLENGAETVDFKATPTSSDTSIDSNDSGIKHGKRNHSEDDEFFFVDKKGRFEIESSPPPRPSSKSEKTGDYETNKRNTRLFIANMVVKFITEMTKAELDEKFLNGVRTTVLDCFIEQNRRLDYYEKLKAMPAYKLTGTVSDMLDKYDYCGPLRGDERGVLMKLLETVYKTSTLGMDSLRKSAPCATHQPFSFAKWTDDDGELHLFDRGHLKRAVTQPLGAAFDGVKGFLFTGNSCEIMRSSENGDGFEVLVTTAKNPSAIAVIKCGERFAYLDKEGIHIYDFITKTSTKLVSGLNARGLVYLASGDLVTAVRSRNGTRICAFDVNKKNKHRSICTYDKGFIPSFMTSVNSTVYMTNLDAKVMDMYEMDDRVLKHVKTVSLTQNLPKKCQFPSGIVADSRKEVILCDARKGDGFLLWSSATLDDWKVVKTTGPFPYTASIAISPSGTLLAACRSSNTIRFFGFKK